VIEYEVKADDTLSDIADGAGVPLRALAFANGITKADELLHIGQKIVIPPGDGALYYVKEGDTPESVAERFKVEPKVIMSYNRVYFEPEHFATGQLIFVPGADLPAIKQSDRPRSIPLPTAAELEPREGALMRPVNGRLTQNFWWAHTGIDIAAPYGSPIRASAPGKVVATGWVAVGGIRVCIAHSGGLQTCYYHMASVQNVKPGDDVKAGDLIGVIGMTGVTTGPHVHWECRLNNQYVSCFGL
jgi:murein DD-endopeptidase MepM/ murein hydrolase activator NlpD